MVDHNLAESAVSKQNFIEYIEKVTIYGHFSI